MSMNIEMRFDSTLKFSWEASDIKTAIESISFLHGLPEKCPVCEAPIHFFYRSPQGNAYYGLICVGAPAHEVNFGQHKEGGSLFYKGDGAWELEYSARQGTAGAPAQPGTAAAAPAQPAPTQQTTSAPAQSQTAPATVKADPTVLSMIGAVGRAKAKGTNLDEFAKRVLGEMGLPAHTLAELSADEADIVLSALKSL
jgi:hypothetical protein